MRFYSSFYSVFIPIPKAMPKNAPTTAQLHSSQTPVKWCSKFSKPGLNSTWTVNFQMFKMNLEKAEEPEIKLPRFTWSWRKQENPRKTSTFALLIMPKPLIVWSEVKVAQLCPTLCDPMNYTVHGILQTRILEWGSLSLLQGHLPNPGSEPRSLALQADSLPAEPQEKQKDIRMGSLSLLQRIVLTQELNWISCIAGGFFTNWAREFYQTFKE